MRRCIALLFGLLCLLLAGCGGSGGGEGRATLTIRWPETTRLIPFAANCIRGDVTRGAQGPGTTLLVRPSGGGSATASFDRLPVGAATVTATA